MSAESAGLFRRTMAFFLDMIAIYPTLLIAFLPAVFFPVDRYYVWISVFGVVVMLPAMAYIFFGLAFLPNTYGRYAMGTRVVDIGTGARPGWSQVFVRSLTTGLWPIEGILIAVSPSRRRLGDRWADTRVIRYQPAAPMAKRLLPGLAMIAVSSSVYLMFPLILGRMDISRAAVAHVRQAGSEPVGAPGQVEIVNDTGTVTLRLQGGRYVRVHLASESGQWKAERVESIPREELGGGFMITGNTQASSR